MEAKQYTGLDIRVFEETLNNGLKVYLSPMPVKEIYAKMVVSTGLAINKFTFEGKHYEVSPHTAHFLEHILFYKEGGDISNIFIKNSSEYNATTTLDETNYWFSGYNNFYENLHALLKVVNEPYFSDKEIVKEKGIIEAELRSRVGSPSAMAYDNLTKNVFHTSHYKNYNNFKKSMLEDLYDITKEELEIYYKAFYHPNNMYLVIVGNINPKEIIDFLNSYYQKEDNIQAPQIKMVNEPETVLKEKEYIQSNIAGNIIQITDKVKITNTQNLPLDYANMNIYISKKLSVLSKLKDITEKDDNYIIPYSTPTLDVMDGYYIIQSYTKVKEEKNVVEILMNELQNKNVTKEEFELLKKYQMSTFLKKLDYPKKLGCFISGQVKLYKKPIYDIYMIYKKLDYENFLEYINNLNFDNKTVLVYKKEI